MTSNLHIAPPTLPNLHPTLSTITRRDPVMPMRPPAVKAKGRTLPPTIGHLSYQHQTMTVIPPGRVLAMERTMAMRAGMDVLLRTVDLQQPHPHQANNEEGC